MHRYQLRAAATAIYPDSLTGSVTALAYVTLGLTGEAGEVANKLKKVMRDGRGEITPAVRQSLSDELGDVLWYVAMMATELELDLADVAGANLNKLAVRESNGTLQGSGDDR